MRSGMWVLAACGIVGLAVNLGTAEEGGSESGRFSFGEPAFKRTIQYFSRGGRTAEASGETDGKAEQPQNPVAETFPGSADARFPDRSFNGQGINQMPSPANPGNEALLPGVRNYHQELFGSERPQSAAIERARTAQKEAEATDDLIHAEHQRSRGASRRGEIEPVRATEENVSPFRRPEEFAVPPADDEEEQEQPEMRLSIDDEGAEGSEGAESNDSRDEEDALDASVEVSAAPVGAQTPMVTVRWIKRSDINVGQPCQCDLVVLNTGKVVAKDVTLDAHFPTSVRLTDVKPSPVEKSGHLSWNFASLAPGEEQKVRITMIPSRRGELKTTAFVRFTGAASEQFTVEEPLLEISMEGPQEVMAGDPASQIVVVSNTGTGVANNVSIEALIPEGLEHRQGDRLVMEIGSLNPGESRMVRLALAAGEGGKYPIKVEATAGANLRQSLTHEIQVVAPKVRVDVHGPGLRHVGRNATYRLTVTNEGGAASNNVRVMHQVPEGFRFVRADKGGKYDTESRTASWFVGRLEGEQSVELQLDLVATKAGGYVHHAGAVSEQGIRSESRLETQIEGSASLDLEILEANDPVKVGTETTYEIRVRNTGSQVARNVGVSCEMAAAVEFLGARGPTDHIVENGLILFKSLRELEPGKAALYRVQVSGKNEGNHRFRARLASDSIQEPLIFEETTRFYVD